MNTKSVVQKSCVLRTLCAATVLLVVMIGEPSIWAAADDYEDEGTAVPSANLTVYYDARGTADVTFQSDADIQDWKGLAKAIEAALGCPERSLSHPEAVHNSLLRLENIPARRLAQFEAQLAQQQRRTLHGTCSGAMKRQQFILSSDLSFVGVLPELRKMGEQQLGIRLVYPKSSYSWHTPSTEDSVGLASYVLNVDDAVAQPIHLEFGFRRSDVIRAAAVPIGFLLLPILIVLWMRRAALRGAKDDPTAAWFGYMRVLNWCTLGTILLWMVGHSVRQGFEDLAAYNLASHNVAAAVLRVTILLLPPWIVYGVCLAFSYAVYFHVRGDRWTRREFCSISCFRSPPNCSRR